MRHRYLTVVQSWDPGQVVLVGEGRKYQTRKASFDFLSEEQKHSIEAIAIDIWDPYLKAVKECCPETGMVFDPFPMVKAFGRVIDQVRTLEYHQATSEGKEVIRGSKYLLLKNKANLSPDEKPRLQTRLELNQNLTTLYILKDLLKKLWQYRYPAWARKALDEWCSMALESQIGPVINFAKMLKRYAYGILNHCRFPIHTSRWEGINNKIKVIKRKAYGFHDVEYFSLIIRDSFARSN
ncbi:MAG: ISL3 family transposase [Candidatus Atribacteria bacterium]|nr:ISL3 family transposase [Candidatus Atribacteria bacterium]